MSASSYLRPTIFQVALGLLLHLAPINAGHAANEPARKAPANAHAEVLEEQAQSLGHHLRCPVCQGMPISESPATMAVDMMQQVRRMLADGMRPDEIDAYFVERYGQWVLLDPPKQGFTLWAWLLPPMVFLAALLLFLRLFKRSGQAPDASAWKKSSSPEAQPTASSLLQNVRDEVEQ